MGFPGRLFNLRSTVPLLGKVSRSIHPSWTGRRPPAQTGARSGVGAGRCLRNATPEHPRRGRKQRQGTDGSDTTTPRQRRNHDAHGYAEFLDIIVDPGNPEHRDTKRWVGGHFDPEWFDCEFTDRDVRNALRANRPHPPPPAPTKNPNPFLLIVATPRPSSKLSLHKR
jgi:hypothetical protein